MEDKEHQKTPAALREEAHHGLAGQGALVETMFRLKDSVDEQNKSATKLGNRIWWLNLWLLVVTITIFGLTAVLVWYAVQK